MGKVGKMAGDLDGLCSLGTVIWQALLPTSPDASKNNYSWLHWCSSVQFSLPTNLL